MKNTDPPSPTSSESTQKENNTPPFDSIVDTRQLNALCKKFKRNGTPPQFINGTPPTGPDNYSAVDDGVTTLSSWCSSNNCCSTDGVVGLECIEWSSKPDTVYEVCKNSCNGDRACASVARNAGNGSTITFESGSCSSTDGYSCLGMASSTTKKLNLFVGEGSCSNANSCYGMAAGATNLEELSIGQSSCTKPGSCVDAAFFAESLKQLYIDAGECNSQNTCENCGYDSTFGEALQLTTACCNEEGSSGNDDRSYYFDTACQYSEPSASPSISSISSMSSVPSDQPSNEPPEEPNPCKNVNCSNRGKCHVLSFTEAKCQCENTFIQSDSKLDCICPSNHEFNANVNRCFPITEVPSKSPNLSPTSSPTLSPTSTSTTKKDVCEDDETATFELIKIDKDVPCSWITKNWKKRSIRKMKYCGLDDVKAKCPESCGLCSE